MCACDFNFTCSACAPTAKYDDDSYMSPGELERERRDHELSAVDFLAPRWEA